MAKKSRSSSPPVHISPNFAYLTGSKTAVVIGTSKGMMGTPEAKAVKMGAAPSEVPGFIPWGKNNKRPTEIRDKIEKSELVSSNMLFLVTTGYGAGLETGYIDPKSQRFVQKTYPESAEFFRDNDVPLYLLKAMTDMQTYYNTFTELLLNRDDSKRKVLGISCKDAIFSRWGEADLATGKIEWHFYSALFEEGKTPAGDTDVVITPVLDDELTVLDARRKLGLIPNSAGVTVDEMKDRYIVPAYFPTPGSRYYKKPYWWTIFESGWYDFAVAIPEFKSALMRNQVTIKYHIELSDKYFPTIFAEEGIRDEKDKLARKKKEFEDLDAFLKDTKNTGKSVISYTRQSPGGEEHMMQITVLDNKFKGGEYVEDSEEAANIISYGMGVHPSLQGAAPGKSKTINGTEARELFLIKQCAMQPFRDRLLKPFYVIKALNGWPDEMEFRIPNLVLTTLDKNPQGAEKATS